MLIVPCKGLPLALRSPSPPGPKRGNPHVHSYSYTDDDPGFEKLRKKIDFTQKCTQYDYRTITYSKEHA